MKTDKFVYQWERETVRLRHFEGLQRQQIADRLGLRFAQVKYIFSKPNVKGYIQREILPSLWEKEIAELEGKLSDPIEAFADELVQQLHAQTYQWFGPGQKEFYDDNKKQMQALNQWGRMLGLFGDQKSAARDLEKAIFKHAATLQDRVEFLKSQLASIQEN